ncbi:hypothetical protein COE91_21095 [Bacillus toyonensis]|nr:hypothetical protein COE91_21095 [Bacillus toyonensis]
MAFFILDQTNLPYFYSLGMYIKVEGSEAEWSGVRRVLYKLFAKEKIFPIISNKYTVLYQT